jgi:acetyl esterase/lipase
MWLFGLGVAIGCAGAQRAYGQRSDPAALPIAHVYRQVDAAALKAYVFSPDRPAAGGRAPAVLLFHGGGWVAGAPDWVFSSARRFAALGLVAVAVEYRLSTDSVTPIDALADVCSAFRWVRGESAALGVDPRRVAAYGVSAGGHLAAAAATIGCDNADGPFGAGGPDALVLWSPALDVRNDGHFRRLLRERARPEAYSPMEHVRARMPPVSIVQGERDNLTPLSMARRFCDRVLEGGGRCELHVYPGVGHLLTRNLSNQESDFDPDPLARDDGIAKQAAFLRLLWLR